MTFDKRMIGLLLIMGGMGYWCEGVRADYRVDFDLKSAMERSGRCCEMAENPVWAGEVIKDRPQSDRDAVIVWQAGDPGDWERARYLVCELWHENDYSAVVNLEFFEKQAAGGGQIVAQSGPESGSKRQEPRMAAKIGILPKLRTQMVFDLNHLDGQNIFMARVPRQLKCTVLGQRLERGDIGKVALRIGPYQPPRFKPTFYLGAVWISDRMPEPLPEVAEPVVDAFGQWTAREWPGKIADLETLKRLNETQLAEAGEVAYPEDWSVYGGWKKRRFEATGFFRTHHDGKRWWLVDPEGCAFISVGVDCIGTGASGTVTGQEDLFAWLPQRDDPLLGGTSNRRRGGSDSVNFYQLNLVRVFGEQWREAWETITTGQLKRYRINTIANWSDMRYARAARVPYVYPMGGFPSTRTQLFRDFPDVYAEEYGQKAGEFARQLEPMKDDPYLIGYFLRNEPTWAFGDHTIAFEMFATDQPSASKQAFVAWLKERYPTVAAFNRAWKLELKSIDEIGGQTFKTYPSEAAKADFREFTGLLVERYVQAPCEAVKQIDPHHLNLGMRYAWISSDLLYRAGEAFDVFSINGYGNPGPPETAEIARRSGKPVMIGEFHFGAVDRGLPATGIQGALNQQQRAVAYRYYVEQGAARPELIGMHYFQWLDQPIFGRFDGENYNIGLIDICNRPYEELTEAARLTHERIYEVATGAVAPFDEVIERIPSIHY